jgi:Acetyltransferase (GNAT) domain
MAPVSRGMEPPGIPGRFRTTQSAESARGTAVCCAYVAISGRRRCNGGTELVDAVPVLSDQTNTAARPAWHIMSVCPPEWQTWLEACDAGFFQSPRGIQAGAPPGEPLYCVHFGLSGVDGIAVGVRHACRLSRHPRHVYLPSIPAFCDVGNPSAPVDDLVFALRNQGAAEVVMDSFDASCHPEFRTSTVRVLREEFVLSLEGAPEEMLARCTQHHRRHIRKGDRSHWTLRTHVGVDARGVLGVVQHAARVRADHRGTPFGAPAIAAVAEDRFEPGSPWGSTVFAAWDGDVVLAAMLVGWGGRHAYYVAGGSTPSGYAAGAGVWLQWRIATALADTGRVSYNLGGAPVSGTDGTGLRRFKEGFGTRPVPCVGARWQLRRLHLGAHAALHWRPGRRPS